MTIPLAVALDHVAKRWGAGPRGATALADLSLHVPAGEFVALVGPSGAGKSTVLNLIAGLDVPTAGRVVVAGADLARLSDDARSDLRLRHIGFVFQQFHLFPTFTVEENVAWPLEFLGWPWRAARERAAAALAEVALPAALVSRRPAELSGGEQQRVAIARALVTAPRLLLADEPTGNLDSATGRTILELLRRLHAAAALTILLVTHSPVAAAHAERIVELRDGRLVADTRTTRRRAGGQSFPMVARSLNRTGLDRCLEVP